MTHMLIVPTFELGYPMLFMVLMKAGDAAPGHASSPFISSHAAVLRKYCSGVVAFFSMAAD